MKIMLINNSEIGNKRKETKNKNTVFYYYLERVFEV